MSEFDRPDPRAVLAAFGIAPGAAAAAINAERREMPVGDAPNTAPPDVLGMLKECGIDPATVAYATIGEPANADPNARRFLDIERRVHALERYAGMIIPALRNSGYG
jgi:hypothetical protein